MASLDYAGGLTDRGKRVVSTSSSNPGAETTKEVKETIAYFIHHAVAKGITPSEKTETGKVLNKFRQAFRKFMGYFLSETDSITGQDIVDMAYGAAFLELGSQFAGADTRTSLVEQRKLTKEQESGVAFNNALIEIDRKKQRVGRFRSIEAVNTMRQNAEIDLVLKEINRRKNSDKDNSVDMDFTRNFEKKDYWSDRIDAFIAKRLPKNDKGHYITDNYIPLLADWKKFQDERATLEKNLRKGLRKTANERIKDAAEHEARMNDPDGSLNVDLDYSMNTQEKEENKQEVATIRIWIRDHWGETAAQIWTDFTNIFQGGANSTKFLHQFINDVKDVMPGAKKWHDAILMLEKTRNEIKQTVDDIAIRAREMSEKNLIRVNEKSTVEQLWGYNPYKKTDPRYKKVKIDPEMQKIFESLNKEQKQLAVDVFAHGDLMLKRKRDIARAFGVSDNFFGVSGLEGPYAPLRRFGNYVAEFKSQAYLDAEAALEDKPNENNRNALEKLKADSKEYEVSFHGSMGKAEAYVDTNKKRFAYAEASEKTKINSESNSPDYQVLSKVLAGLRASDFGKDTAEYKAIKEMIENMYFDTLSEDNARRSQAKRKSIAGYETNMMRSFLANATAEANLIANMEHGTDVNVALLEARKEKNKPGNKAKLSRVYNLMVSHYASNLNQRPTPIQDRVAALNTVYMLTSSIGYHITNATQPIMVTIPKLVGDFGATNYGKTMKLYWQGLSMARDVVTFNAKNFKFQTAIDIDKAPLKYQPLLKELQLRQLLDVGIEQDLAEL